MKHLQIWFASLDKSIGDAGVGHDEELDIIISYPGGDAEVTIAGHPSVLGRWQGRRTVL